MATGQCDARLRPTVKVHSENAPLGYLSSRTAPPSFDRCQIILLGEQKHVCEQLAQNRYLAVTRPGVKPATSELRVRHATVTPPSHTERSGKREKRKCSYQQWITKKKQKKLEKKTENNKIKMCLGLFSFKLKLRLYRTAYRISLVEAILLACTCVEIYSQIF